MALTVNYGGLGSAFSGANGLKGYFDYYQSTYSSTGHASSMAFHNSPVSAVQVGATSYNPVYFGVNVIGEYMSNTSTTVSNVSFLAKAASVTYENSAGSPYSAAYMFYTGGTAPNHTLSGAIDTLSFGNGAYSSGALASTLFTIDGLDAAIGNGFLDSDSDGYVDGILGRLSTSPNNLVHDLIYDLMGGMGGAGGASVLEGILNLQDITYVGTSTSEVFDSYNGFDTFTGNGGNDKFRFEAGFGEDVITDFVAGAGATGDELHFSSSVFGLASDVIAAGTYVSGVGYVIDDGNFNTVTLTGVTSLSASDIVIF